MLSEDSLRTIQSGSEADLTKVLEAFNSEVSFMKNFYSVSPCTPVFVAIPILATAPRSFVQF